MEMEGVDMVQGKHVDVLLHEVDVEEMTCDIEMHAAIGKAGSVGHRHGRDLHVAAL